MLSNPKLRPYDFDYPRPPWTLFFATSVVGVKLVLLALTSDRITRRSFKSLTGPSGVKQARRRVETHA